jgi:hypothetical protein
VDRHGFLVDGSLTVSKQTLRVVAHIQNAGNANATMPVSFEVREAVSNAFAGSGQANITLNGASEGDLERVCMSCEHDLYRGSNFVGIGVYSPIIGSGTMVPAQ